MRATRATSSNSTATPPPTNHALGFRPPVPGGAAGEVEHQFLNTGLAVHAAVIRRFLDAEGIAYASER